MVEFIFIFLYILLSLVLIILVHELGHILALKRWAINAELTLSLKPLSLYVGQDWMYNKLSPKKRIGVYLLGILTGFFCICCLALLNPFALLFILPYLAGIKSDIDQIIRDYKLMIQN